MNCFWIHEYMKQFWHRQTCKICWTRQLFMIVLRIPCNFFIVLPIWLKASRSNVFSFLQCKICTPEKSGAFQRFCMPEHVSSASDMQFVQAWYSNLSICYISWIYLKCGFVCTWVCQGDKFQQIMYRVVVAEGELRKHAVAEGGYLGTDAVAIGKQRNYYFFLFCLSFVTEFFL